MTPREDRELASVVGAGVTHRRARGHRCGRGRRPREGAEGGVARHAPSALRLPRPLAGEALYDVEAQDAGVRRALRLARRSWASPPSGRPTGGRRRFSRGRGAGTRSCPRPPSARTAAPGSSTRGSSRRGARSSGSRAPARSSPTSTRGWSATGRCPPPATAWREASTSG